MKKIQVRPGLTSAPFYLCGYPLECMTMSLAYANKGTGDKVLKTVTDSDIPAFVLTVHSSTQL